MIRQAQAEDLAEVREIFREYASSLPAGHICFTRFEQELSTVLETYPVILLSYDGNALAGCVAMRPLEGSVCEMKRLYVREPWRGTGLGRLLVERILQEARERGFEAIRLDTMRQMVAAHALYQRLGFQRIPPYNGQPQELVCMELQLTHAAEMPGIAN